MREEKRRGTSGDGSAGILRLVRELHPRVHCITNLAAGPDVANILLAAGARPILAQAKEEAGEIAAACSASVLNFGTPDREKLEAATNAGLAAGAAGVPVTADPVGVGASAWRREQVLQVLEKIRPDVIHCNFSEGQILLGEDTGFHGVDSACADLEERIRCAGQAAERYGCIVLLTGKEDVVSDGKRTRVIRGGSPAMGQITGTGCMLSAITGAFCAAARADGIEDFAAVSAAASFWKACGKQAWEETEKARGGSGTFHGKLFDMAGFLTEWREEIEDITR